MVSLYRYYRKLTTLPGQRVAYSDDEVAMLQASRLGLFVANPIFLGLHRSRFRLELAQDVGVENGIAPGVPVLPPGSPLIATGHSLGGHLALLFGRLFPEVTEHVYTYNAPGIGPLGALALWKLGIPPLQPSRVTNVASAMGGELISLIPSKPGETIGIATEAGSLLYQHSIVPLTDALALYGAFATLSPGLAGDPATIGSIIAAASYRSEDSLEFALDHLRAALGIGSGNTPVARELSDLDARDGYYRNLYELLDGRESGRDYQIVSLAGRSAGELASMAASDASVRYSLRELIPFAVTNAGNSSIADTHTSTWRSARAEMLAVLLGRNQADLPFGVTDAARSFLFEDRATAMRFSVLTGSDAIVARQFLGSDRTAQLNQYLDNLAYGRNIVFGSDEAIPGEAISGTQGADLLFGAAGDDSLEGAAGDDYLEGAAGDDVLDGGAGEDTLDGGEGSDRLMGGAGIDTYRLGASLDADTIVDADGLVYAGSSLLSGGSGDAGGSSYVSSDGAFSYAFTGDLELGGTLTVNGALRIENFRNGDLGIRLAQESNPGPVNIPVPEALLAGDYVYAPLTVPGEETIYLDPYGNPYPITQVGAAPGRNEQFFEFPGTPGHTHYALGGGDDQARDVWGGDDWIELGDGNDSGDGGAGNDLLEGGPGSDLLEGGA
ncbi:MAG: hypothetical protein ACREEP_12830, partial [Dongiaceae bacterium]